jgi:hypothetical protein
MEDEEFKRRLSEVAEWHIPKLKDWEVDLAKQKARGRGRPTNEEQYQDEHEQIFLEIFNGVNPTYTPQVTKVKIQPTVCNDCGRHCPEGRRQEIKFYNQPNHAPHRRERCLECNLYRDPDTGIYELKQGPAAQVFLNWAKREFNARKKPSNKDKDK